MSKRYVPDRWTSLIKKELSLTNDVHRTVRSKHDVGRRIESYSSETPENPDMKVDHDRQG